MRLTRVLGACGLTSVMLAASLVSGTAVGSPPAPGQILAPGQAVAPVPTGGVLGNDISWPNCPRGMGVPDRRSLGLPLPDPAAQFVIIGLTNGRAFTRNPCLKWHVTAAQARGLQVAAYTVLSYPNAAELRRYRARGPFSAATRSGQLANVGYAQTSFALDAMTAGGLAAPLVWLDIEPRANRRWSSNKGNNQAVVNGALRAVADRGIASGIYTYQVAWRAIVGALRVDVPLWAPSHTRSRSYAAKQADALASCSRVSFTGGPLVITQWVHRNRDYDVTCPTIATTTRPYFLQFVPVTPATR